VWRSATDERLLERGIPTEDGSAALLDRLNSIVREPKAAAPPLIVTMNEIPGMTSTRCAVMSLA